ncbi:MAG: vWA domain-containing protein [Alphaproteobacteria bacterium]
MNDIGDIIGSVSFTTPAGFLVSLPFLALLGWQLANRANRGTVALTGLEYLEAHGWFSAAPRRWLRAVLWGTLAAMIGVLWAGPVYHSSRPLFAGASQTVHKNFVLMVDISRSMTVPLGQEKIVSLPGQPALAPTGAGTEKKPKVPRYQAARKALMDFVARFKGERIGLILFSTEPILARWPTVETENRFWEILEENIGRGVESQIQAFSSLTNTDKALSLARDVFAAQDVVGDGAVILITDAEDDVQNIGVAARNLRKDRIRLYIIGVGIAQKIADGLTREFAADPGFRIFRVDSEHEMREAYRLVGEVEELPRFKLDHKEYTTDIRWILALALVVLATIVLGILNLAFHQSQAAGAQAAGRSAANAEGGRNGLRIS